MLYFFHAIAVLLLASFWAHATFRYRCEMSAPMDFYAVAGYFFSLCACANVRTVLLLHVLQDKKKIQKRKTIHLFSTDKEQK